MPSILKDNDSENAAEKLITLMDLIFNPICALFMGWLFFKIFPKKKEIIDPLFNESYCKISVYILHLLWINLVINAVFAICNFSFYLNVFFKCN